jgi:uncharacterized membrane protein HdeD (DUF308 family)
MSEQNAAAGKHWPMKFWTGVIAIILGLLALFFPGAMTDFLGIFAGIFVIMLSGIILTEDIFLRHRHGTARWAGIGLALLGILGGIILLAFPVLLVIGASLFMGGYFVLYGGLELFSGLSVDIGVGTRALEIVSGLIAMVAGIFVVLIPVFGFLIGKIDVTTLIVGVFLVIFGVLRIMTGRKHREAAAGTAGNV